MRLRSVCSGDQDAAELLQAGRWLFERADDRFAFRDRQPEDRGVALQRLLEQPGELVVVNESREFEDRLVL